VRSLVGSDFTEYTANCVILMLLYVCRSVETSDIIEENVVAMNKSCHDA
jgi:hypothetical protein